MNYNTSPTCLTSLLLKCTDLCDSRTAIRRSSYVRELFTGGGQAQTKRVRTPSLRPALGRRGRSVVVPATSKLALPWACAPGTQQGQAVARCFRSLSCQPGGWFFERQSSTLGSLWIATEILPIKWDRSQGGLRVLVYSTDSILHRILENSCACADPCRADCLLQGKIRNYA